MGDQLILPRWLESISKYRTEQAALVDDAGSVLWPDLIDAARRVAAALPRCGVNPGDRVLTAMVPSAPHVVVVLGAMFAGAIPCPFNIKLTEHEGRAFCAPLSPALVICDPANAGLGGSLGIPQMVLERVDESAPIGVRLAGLQAPPVPSPELREEAPAIIFGTGGTTGTPKGAYWSHRGLWLYLNSNAQDCGRSSRDVELFFSTFFHIALTTGLMTTLFVGGSVRILPSFDAGAALRALGEGVTMLMGAPTMFATLASHPDFAEAPRDKVSYLYYGSMASSESFIAELRRSYPSARLRSGFGATEFGPVAKLDDADIKGGRLSGMRPVIGARIRVIREDGSQAAPGEIGEMEVDCPWRTVGYWNRPEETAATYLPTGVRIGDLAHLTPEGRLYIAGRKKEMIVSGGENVFPNEVEQVLGRHPAITQVVVYGVPDSHWGERVEAAVVLKDGASLTYDQLKAFGRGQLARYKVPKVMRLMPGIPLTATGKTNRRELQRLAVEAESSPISD